MGLSHRWPRAAVAGRPRGKGTSMRPPPRLRSLALLCAAALAGCTGETPEFTSPNVDQIKQAAGTHALANLSTRPMPLRVCVTGDKDHSMSSQTFDAYIGWTFDQLA